MIKKKYGGTCKRGWEGLVSEEGGVVLRRHAKQMFGRKKRPMLTRGQIREDWNWPLDWAVNLGKVKCSFDRVVKANHEENGFKKWCKRSVRSRVHSLQRLCCNDDHRIAQSLRRKVISRDKFSWCGRWLPASEVRGTVQQREENLWCSGWRWGWLEPHLY